MHEIFGIDEAAFDGRQETLFDAVVPEDRHILTEAAARFEATKTPELLKYRIRRPDGGLRHVWAYGETVVDPDGTEVAIGYVLDVSERVEVEDTLRRERDQATAAEHERFHAMVMHAPIPAMVHAEDGEILMINDLWTEVTGYTPDEMSTIHAWTELAYPDTKDEILARIRKLFDLAGPADEDEIVVLAKNGSRKVFLFSHAAVGRAPDGRRVVLSMANDITRVRMLERERRAFERQLHRIEKVESLGVLAGGIAHDFNNLLMGVLGNASVARDHTDSPEMLEILTAIEHAAEKAASLSRDMLTYAGRQEPARVAIDIDDAVTAVRPLATASISHRHTLTFELGARSAKAMLGTSELDQVVLNLISNAAEACGDAAGHIRVTTGTEELGSRDLARRALGDEASPGIFGYVQVSDDGAGMTDAVRARVFEPFFTAKPHGRGLGMSVVLGIARAAHGVVQVTSELGKGTTLRVSFPVVRGDAAADAESGRALARPPVIDGRCALVVDDEDTVRAAIARMLIVSGYRVYEAGSAEEALELVAEHADELHVALVDLTMPDAGGNDFVVRLRRDHASSLPVMLMSGYAREAVPGLDDLDFQEFLAKPFSLGLLRTALARVLSAA